MDKSEKQPEIKEKAKKPLIPSELVPVITALIGALATIIAAYFGYLAMQPPQPTPILTETVTLTTPPPKTSTPLPPEIAPNPSPQLSATSKAAQQACGDLKASLKTYPVDKWAVNGYRPHELYLTYAVPVENLTEPVYDGREQLYGLLQMDGFGEFVVVIDQESKSAAIRLYIDQNQNQDLTDDPSYLFSRSDEVEWVNNITMELQADPYYLAFYRIINTETDDPGLSIYYRSRTLRVGCMRIGDQTTYVGVFDDDANGIFFTEQDVVIIDKDGDKDFDRRVEGNQWFNNAIEWGESCYKPESTSDTGYELSFENIGRGIVRGQVIDAITVKPISDVRMKMDARESDTITDFDGRFEQQLCPGFFFNGFDAEHPGYIPLDGKGFQITENSVTEYDLVLEPKPTTLPQGEVTLKAGQGYHFLKGEVIEGYLGAFNVEVFQGEVRFDTSSLEQKGLIDLGDFGPEVDLSQVAIPNDGFDDGGLPVLRGHIYISMAHESEGHHYITFYVVDVVGDRVTFRYLYR